MSCSSVIFHFYLQWCFTAFAFLFPFLPTHWERRIPQTLLPYLFSFLTRRIMWLVANEKGRTKSNLHRERAHSFLMYQVHRLELWAEANKDPREIKKKRLGSSGEIPALTFSRCRILASSLSLRVVFPFSIKHMLCGVVSLLSTACVKHL